MSNGNGKPRELTGKIVGIMLDLRLMGVHKVETEAAELRNYVLALRFHCTPGTLPAHPEQDELWMLLTPADVVELRTALKA